jgi:hypothetical protein
MRAIVPLGLGMVVAVGFADTAKSQPRTGGTYVVTNTVMAGPGGYPSPVPRGTDVVIVGKVVEVDRDDVEVVPYRGAPKERMLKYKVATVQIEDRVLGAGGITRIRVGYLANANGFAGGIHTPVALTATNGGRPPGVVTVAPGLEGCFALAKHPNADFYVVVGAPTYKKDSGFAKEVDRLKKYARTIDDPVAALKAKDLNDRFDAAQILLQRYLMPQGSSKREPVPDEENMLLVALLTDLPWVPADGKRTRADGRIAPHRAALWYSINPGEFGFTRPNPPKRNPGDPPPNMDKLMDEATTKFLTENGDKIKLKRFVQK